MVVKRKARRFVQLLAEQLKSDSLNNNHDQDLRTAFRGAVASLPQGPLKTELDDRLKVYFKKFKVYCKERETPTGQKEDKDGDEGITTAVISQQAETKLVFPYNLYNKKGFKINPAAMENMEQEKQQQIYKCLLSTQMHLMSDEKILALLAEMKGHSVENESDPTSSTDWVDDMVILANIVVSQQDPAALQKVMTIFNSKLSATVDVLLTEKKPKRVYNLKKKVFQFIQLFHMKHKQTLEFPEPPRFKDLMAALLSIYIDLEVADARKLEEKERLMVGKKLASAVTLFFQHAPQYGVDVIAQLGTLNEETLTLLYPLLWKFLEVPVINGAEEYTKYVCTLRQVMQLLQDEDQIVMAGSQIAAPKHYVSWLKERDSSIVDEMPETKHFRGVHITTFLLREASSDVIDQLLNVVTADMEKVTEEQVIHSTEDVASSAEKPAEEVVEETQKIEEEPIFFIDKTADSKTTEEMKVAYPDLGDVKGRDTEDDAESIVINDTDLDRMLAEMDESSSDESEADDGSITGNNDNGGDEEEENRNNSSPMKSVLSKTERALSDIVKGGEDSCSMLNDFVLTPEKVVSPLKDSQSPKLARRRKVAQAMEPVSPEIVSSALDESHSETGIDTATNDEDESCDDFDTTVIDIEKPPPRIVTAASPSSAPVHLVAIEKTGPPSFRGTIPLHSRSPDSCGTRTPERPKVSSPDKKSPKLDSPKSPKVKSPVPKSRKLLSLDGESESARLVSAEEVEAEWQSLVDSPLKNGQDLPSQDEPDTQDDATSSAPKRPSTITAECTPTKRTRRSSRQPMAASEDEMATELDEEDPLRTPTRAKSSRSVKKNQSSESKLGQTEPEKLVDENDGNWDAVMSSPGVMTRRRRRTMSDASEMSDTSEVSMTLRSRTALTPNTKESKPVSSPSKAYGLRRRSMPSSPLKVSSPASKLKAIPEDAPKTRVNALRAEAGSKLRSPTKTDTSELSPKRTPRRGQQLFDVEEYVEVDENISFKKTPSPKKAASPVTPTRTTRRRSAMGSAKK